MKYFTIENPFPQVFRLEDPRGVFLTLIAGKTCAFLADTGMGIGDAAAAVREITGLPLITANTHGHIDHMGGNYQFGKVWQSGYDHMVSRGSMARNVKELILNIPGAPIPDGFDRERFLSCTADNLADLKPDTHFDLGGLSVITIPLPSHTRGSVGFLCPELGLLLSGDSIAPVVYLVFEESSGTAEHISLLHFAETLPFEQLLTSHNRELIPKSDIRRYIECAEAIVPEKSEDFHNVFSPETPAKMFVYNNPNCFSEYTAVAYTLEKLGG